MDKGMQEFLANAKEETQEISFEPSKTETETSSDSPAETKPEGQEPPQGGAGTPGESNLPFHKHPRWIEKEQKEAQLLKEIEELRKFRDEASPVLESVKKQDAEKKSTIPAWWEKLYGNAPESLEAFNLYLENDKSQRESIKQEILTEQRAETDRQKNEEKKWSDFIEQQIGNLQAEGLAFDRNELLKVVDEYSRDADGNYLGQFISFRKAYEILELQKGSKADPAKKEARRKIASQTAPDGKPETAPSDTNKVGSLAKRGWWDWDEA